MRSSAIICSSLNPVATSVPHDEDKASISPMTPSAAKRVRTATYSVSPRCIPLRKQRKLVDGVGAESAAQQRGPRFQHPIEGATLPDVGCLSIQRYGACRIKP